MAQIGDKVHVHYRAKLEDGREFSSTYREGKPMELVIGNNRSIPGLEKVLLDMNAGEIKTVVVPAKDAYGTYDVSKIEVLPYDKFPNADELPIGKYIGVNMGGDQVFMKVLKIEEGNVYLDFNHELADHDITLEIDLIAVEAKDAIERELHPQGCACGCDKLKEAIG